MEAACEGGARDDRAAPPDNMKELFEAMMQSVTSLAASLASSHSSSLASDQPPPPGRPAPQHDFRRLFADLLQHGIVALVEQARYVRLVGVAALAAIDHGREAQQRVLSRLRHL